MYTALRAMWPEQTIPFPLCLLLLVCFPARNWVWHPWKKRICRMQGHDGKKSSRPVSTGCNPPQFRMRIRVDCQGRDSSYTPDPVGERQTACEAARIEWCGETGDIPWGLLSGNGRSFW
jgi:hypothetical protein